MKTIDINELPSWSVLAHRLLNGDPLVVAQRNHTTTCQEYDVGIYGRLLQEITNEETPVSLNIVRDYHEQLNRCGEKQACTEQGLPFHEHEQCISLGDVLAVMPRKLAKLLYRTWVVNQVTEAIGECRTIVELACGYGYFLHQVQQQRPDLNYIGVDGSSNATKLGMLTSRNHPNIAFTCFDFYAPESFAFIAEAESPVLVMTVSAVEQLPTVKPLLAALAPHANRIGRVVHIEPCYRPEIQTTLGLLRRRYIENQNYNRDLLPTLRAAEDTMILNEQLDTLGLNPILPASAIRWAYRRGL